jgi:hypothetical protein
VAHKPLTKPQVKFLTRLMREENVAVAGSLYRVAGTLSAQGRCSLVADMASPTAQGLFALFAYRSRRWADCGCEAYALQRQEVLDAIAVQFPEDAKLLA